MRLLINNGKLTKVFFDIRGRLLSELKKHDCEVILTGMDNGWLKETADWNLRYHDFKNAITGINPFLDIKLIFDYIKFIKENNIDVVHSYTAKANIYGSIGARLAGVRKIYPVINGLGYVFTEKSFKTKIVRAAMYVLYKIAFACSTKVFFQNIDDAYDMQRKGIINPGKCVIIPGSGVDITEFTFCQQKNNNYFLLASRLLRTKGIIEYCKAARIVKKKYPTVYFALAGGYDNGKDGINKDELIEYIEDGSVEFLGYVDMTKALTDCSVFVLPSYYREGIPHAVLEAMSTGRAIITCNTPGCKETVRDVDTTGKGKNGFLVEPKNSQALAEKMIWMIEHPEEVKKMGQESRRYAEERFAVDKVNRVLLKTMGIR